MPPAEPLAMCSGSRSVSRPLAAGADRVSGKAPSSSTAARAGFQILAWVSGWARQRFVWSPIASDGAMPAALVRKASTAFHLDDERRPYLAEILLVGGNDVLEDQA